MTVMLLALVSVVGQLEPLEEPLEPLEPAAPTAPASPVEASQPVAAPTAKYAPGTVLYVNASSLALRSGPRRDAGMVHYMPENTRVTVVDDVLEPTPDKIGSKSGHWVRVQHGNHVGYAFDPYLVAAPPALEESLDWVCVPGKRVGPITAMTTHDDLVSVFGASNLGDANIPVGDGKQEAGTVVFPNDRDKRLFVQWEVLNERPHAVIVEGTRWKTPKGIGIGTRLPEILQANQAPVSFAGFGWDYAGYVMSWRGGALEDDHVLGQGLSLFLAAKQPYIPADYAALQGDKEFSSDTPEASKLNLHVSAMTIMLKE